MSSPISAQRRSAQQSSEQFETRMRNRMLHLKSTDSYFFYKRVRKSMATEVVKGPFAYSLEFPVGFIGKHGEKFGTDITFVMKGTKRTWPIELTLRSYKHGNPRVFAYGPGGWKTFLTENQIKVGDILIFHLVCFSKFQVVIGRAPVEVHPDVHGDDNGGEVDHDKSAAKWLTNASPRWNADQAPVSCRVCKLAPPCPRFVVTIRRSSHLQHVSLAVPGRFWELHANMLERDDLQLKGPNKAICTVKAKRIYNAEEKKLSVCLESGWAGFRLDNRLRVGDVLEFFLVGNSCFTVDLVERVENY